MTRFFYLALLSCLFLIAGPLSAQTDSTKQLQNKPQLPTQPGAPSNPAPAREPVIVAPAPVKKPVAPGEVLSESKPAKNSDERRFYERLAFGGGLGLGFYNEGGYFNVSPFVAYKLTGNDRLLIGPGITYQKAWLEDLSATNYGGRIIARYLVFPKFFAHVEQEAMSKQEFFLNTATNQIITNRYLVNSTLVGLGYRSQLGDLSSFDFMALYNTTTDSRDPGSGGIRLQAGLTFNWAPFSW